MEWFVWRHSMDLCLRLTRNLKDFYIKRGVKKDHTLKETWVWLGCGQRKEKLPLNSIICRISLSWSVKKSTEWSANTTTRLKWLGHFLCFDSSSFPWVEEGWPKNTLKDDEKGTAWLQFLLAFPCFLQSLWLFFPFLKKNSVLAGNAKRFQTGRDVSDTQVNQKIRVASPLVAGTRSLENPGGNHSFLSKFPTLFSQKEIRCPLQKISCWPNFNLHHFGGQ